MMFNRLSQNAIMTSNIGFVNLAAASAATSMLMRAYTSVRDLGGPSLGLKKAMDRAILIPANSAWWRTAHSRICCSWTGIRLQIARSSKTPTSACSSS